MKDEMMLRNGREMMSVMSKMTLFVQCYCYVNNSDVIVMSITVILYYWCCAAAFVWVYPMLGTRGPPLLSLQ